MARDYTTESTFWQVRKVLRYIRLYGVRRTLAKVRAQTHMKRRYSQLPALKPDSRARGNVGLIGCGGFAYSTIAYYLRKNVGRVLRGCMDVEIDRAASLFEDYSLDYYTDDPERLFDDPKIDLIYVASNHASHAEYAIQALSAGKSVHIEKPHCVSADQLERLTECMRETRGGVALGFNRPGSQLGRIVQEHLHRQTGPMMLNWFIAGHQIDPDHWYFREEEGGRILGNLCHWTDFVYQMVPEADRFPIIITPTRAQRSDADVAVTLRFGDGSIAALTFSAKGHTFEGVRERFSAHRGDLLVSLDDFAALTLDVGERKKRHRLRYRDHGHERRIMSSYAMVAEDAPGESVAYIWETGQLMLQTRRALEEDRRVTVEAYSG